jgi:hypothetical protein
VATLSNLASMTVTHLYISIPEHSFAASYHGQVNLKTIQSFFLDTSRPSDLLAFKAVFPLKTFGLKISNSLTQVAQEQIRELMDYDYLRQFAPLSELILGLPVEDDMWKELLQCLGTSCEQAKITPGLASSLGGGLFLHLMETRASGPCARENAVCPNALRMELDLTNCATLSSTAKDSVLASIHTLQASRRACKPGVHVTVRLA